MIVARAAVNPAAAALASAAAAAAHSAAAALSAARPAAAQSHRCLHYSAHARRAPAAPYTDASAAFTPRRPAPAAAATASPSAAAAPAAAPAATPFSSLRLSPPLLAAVSSIGLETATPIQALSFPVLSSGKSALLASHPGSGKTLAYLLPIIEELKRDEIEQRVHTRLNRPRALVVVPNRELAIQVLSVAKSLSHQAKFRSFASTGFIPLSKLARALEAPIDLLVVTPGRLDFLVGSGRIQLSDTRYVVLDEADTLLSPEHGFINSLERTLLQPMRGRMEAKQQAQAQAHAQQQGQQTGVQFIFCSASITSAVESHLSSRFPGLAKLHTPSLHHISPDLVMQSILVGNRDKAEVLWELLQRESQNYKRRLMHNRTRQQNQRELAALGGNEQALWEHLAAVDAGTRGVPLTPETLAGIPADPEAVRASVEAAAKQAGITVQTTTSQQIKAQLEFNEAEQHETSNGAATPSFAERDNRSHLQQQHEDDESDPDHPSHHRDSGEDAAPAPAPTSGGAAGAASLFLPLPPTLIFCNTVSCCRAIAWFLSEKGLNVGHYHGLMPSGYRTQHFRNFLSGATNILVATDLASRGLDTTFVNHVIHFDFPFVVLDFIHRVGRTGRAGRRGKSTALIEKKDRVLSEAISRLTQRGLSIEQLSADKAKYGPDGLPLSAAVYASQIERAAALSKAPEKGVTPDGTKLLPSTRRAPKRPSLQPGEQPRRRWMRYMPARARNAHKLLYAKAVEHAKPITAKTLRNGENPLGIKDLPKEKQSAAAAAVAAAASSSGTLASKDRARKQDGADPFAFSSPYGRARNTADPSASPASSSAPSSQSFPAHTRFPQAPGTMRRTQSLRPVGPLAHKQKLGAIFAGGASPASAHASASSREGFTMTMPPSAHHAGRSPKVHHHSSSTSGAAKRSMRKAEARAEGVTRTAHQAGVKHKRR